MGAEEEGLGGRDLPRPIPLALPGLQSLVLGHMSHQVQSIPSHVCTCFHFSLEKMTKKPKTFNRIWPQVMCMASLSWEIFLF